MWTLKHYLTSSGIALGTIVLAMVGNLACKKKETPQVALRPDPILLSKQHEGKRVTIIYSNDINGMMQEAVDQESLVKHLAKHKNFIEQKKQQVAIEHEDTLVVDAGNLFGVLKTSPEKTATRSLGIASAMKSLGYDAVGLGAQDLKLGINVLRFLVERTGLPIVTSNIVNNNGDTLFTEYFIFNRSGIRIGITAVIDPALVQPPPKELTENAFQIRDPLKTIRKLDEQLKDRIDVMIVLSAQKPINQYLFAKQFDRSHLIVANDATQPSNIPSRQQNSYILQTPKGGQFLGLLRLVMRGDADFIFDGTRQLVAIEQLNELKKSKARFGSSTQKANEKNIYDERIRHTEEEIKQRTKELSSLEVNGYHLIFNKIYRL